MPAFFQSILLVDDDEITNFMHKYLLEELSVAEEIHPVNTGQQALTYIQENWQHNSTSIPKRRRKLILLDINMPEMDGFEFLENYHDLQLTDTFTVMLSSSSLQHDKNKAFACGITEYLEKPLSEEKMQTIIDKIEIS